MEVSSRYHGGPRACRTPLLVSASSPIAEPGDQQAPPCWWFRFRPMQHGWMSAPPPSLLLPPLLRLFKPSGETEDTFFADLDVGLSTGQLLPVTQSVVPSTLLQPGKLPNPGPQRYFMASAETQWLLQQSVKPGPSVEQRS